MHNSYTTFFTHCQPQSPNKTHHHRFIANVILEASATLTAKQAVMQSMEAIHHCVPAMRNNCINITTKARKNAHCGQP